MLTHVGGEITKVGHLWVHRIGEAAHAEFKTVAVVDHHHVVPRNQLAPLLRAQVHARVARGVHAFHTQGHDLFFQMNFQPSKRCGLAGTAFVGHAGEGSGKTRIRLQRCGKCVQLRRCARQHAIDALCRHQHTALQAISQRTQGIDHRLRIGQANEFVEGNMKQRRLHRSIVHTCLA